MKIKYIFAFLIVSLSLLTNCNDDISSPENNTTIRTDILGKWHSTFYGGIEFTKEGYFTDSSKTWLCTSTSPKAEYVVKGRYYVIDDIIHFYDVKMTYSMWQDSMQIEGMLSPISNVKISFLDGSLCLQKIQILDPVDEFNTKLTGRWTTIMAAGTYERDQNLKYKGGEIKYVYQFNTDSVTCKINKEILFETIFANTEDTVDYFFVDDYLDFTNGYSYFIKFDNNKMYWYSFLASYQKSE
ncbi:MAG: hypothetical protein V1773_05150 [bacterium]